MKLDIEFQYADGRRTIQRVEAIGRFNHDFLTANAQFYLQIAKLVYDELGEPAGMGFFLGDALMFFNYGAKGRVHVREAAANSPDDGTYRILPRVVLPFQLVVPAQILKDAGTDAIMLLRLGAAANALHALLVPHGQLGHQSGIVKDRDLVHLSIIIASYIKEVDRIINGDKSHIGRLWALAERGIQAGRQLPYESLEECRQLLEPKGRLLKRLDTIRNFVGFHVLPQEFKKWIDAKSATAEITLEWVPNPTRPDVVFVASAQAVADACQQPEDSEFFAAATKLAITLPYLVEAAYTGLLAERGLDVYQFLRFNVKAVFTGAAKWDEPKAS